ncbi:precorrin-2 C(20)-methyltransferase [uncultured Bilophila sp.]|uniref:precorrin-2 C(20)-methyltransferase n=1 Tax=uncultured Bilophila sp. TaxID=529385 RepID=UPI0026DBEBA7|nr:precorrin-2 C(20)-methyltransferase [uncultured Bilophila sp.]
MKSGKLYGVGIGPGDPRYLTLRAADVLRSADVIFTVISRNASSSVSRSVVESLRPRGEIRLQMFSMSRDRATREAQVQANADAIIDELRAGRDCAFATLGDAMTYSTFGYVLDRIRKAIPGVEVEIVPGVTSFATLAAKAETVLVENGEQLRVIPSFRSDMAESLDFPKGSTTILLKTYRSRAALLDRLAREENVEVLYGEHLAMEGQTLLTDPDAIRERPEEYLSLIMVKKQ